MIYPAWTNEENMSPMQVRQAQMRFLISRAAVHASRSHSMGPVALAIGCSEPSLFNAIKKGGCSMKMAVALEKAFGKELMPRAELCPDLHL